MISSALNFVPRLALSTFLTASCFKHVVIRPTLQVISEAESVTVGLIAFSICHSTITLVLAADTVAKKIIASSYTTSENTTKKIAAAADLHKHTEKATQCSTLAAYIHSTDSESEATTPSSAPRLLVHPHSIFKNSDSPTHDVSRHSLSSDTTLVADDNVISHKVTTKEPAADAVLASPRQSQLRPLRLVTKLRATSIDPIDDLTQKMRRISLTSSTFGIPYVPGNQTTIATTIRTLSSATLKPARKATPPLRRKARVGSLRQAYMDHERVSQ